MFLRLHRRGSAQHKEQFIGLDLALRVDFSAFAALTAVTHIADTPNPVHYQRSKTELLRVRNAAQRPQAWFIRKPHRSSIRSDPPSNGISSSPSPSTPPARPACRRYDQGIAPARRGPAYIIAPGGAGFSMRNGLHTIGRQTLLANPRVALETGVVSFPADLH